ncbi:Response regulator with a diguanylate cyclase output domain [Sulfurimonas gotlandica GD1]|uniref:diguanylate cyclase n=1 Tax=Sulfurimonas gotlandica (strain DSM 19862 / JCM 16533 / GD1) TaxID=929558 RepID=B6BK25_SULGG|nr:diguanylate cyclase [Sulfurimonas gotlandica]EDZ62492.1 ggdef domain protein [Sulfurimonas gotlandica GD1]EHP31116.1 Response regulator with a diguanylate cyclase output domain [Sulfurimonas gotlandica GD1]
MKKRFLFPIALKISIFFMVVLLVILFGSAYYVSKESDSTVNNMINGQFKQALNMAENHIELIEQMNKTLVNNLAEDHELINYIVTKNTDKLKDLIVDKRYDIQCDQIILLDNKANVITQSGSAPFDGEKLQNLEIVEKTLNQHTSFTTIIRQFDIFVLYASAPIVIANKQNGMVLIGFSINNNMMKNIKKDTVMDFTVIGDRTVAATSLKVANELMKTLPIPYMDYLWLLKYPDRFYEAKIGNKDYYLTARPLKNMDVTSTASFMMAYPSAEIKKHEEHLFNSILLATFSALGFSIIVVFVFARKIRSIFKMMISQTQKIKDGDYEQGLELHTNDEFELLSRNFNSMSKSLQKQRKTIMDYTNSLESKVEKRTEELNKQKESLEHILDLHSSMILRIEGDRVIYANRAFLDFFNIDSVGFVKNKKYLCELFGAKLENCDEYKSIKTFITSFFDETKNTIYLHTKDNKRKIFEINFISMLGKEDNEVVVFNDVTRLSSENERLEIQATRDVLTGQYNRVKFNQELDKALYAVDRYKEVYSLVLCDIDNFKKINDTYGHVVGDYALVTLANIFSKRIRPTDIFARWGGEEFVLLLPSTEANEAESFSNSLREALSAFSFEHFGQLSCSFGVTKILEDDSAKSLLERADKGLYFSKAHGRNMVKVV